MRGILFGISLLSIGGFISHRFLVKGEDFFKREWANIVLLAAAFLITVMGFGYLLSGLITL